MKAKVPHKRRGRHRAAGAYEAFERTGAQDVDNVIELDDFDFASGNTAEQIVDHFIDQGGLDEDVWLEQQAGELEGLDPNKAYEAWKTGWRAGAIGHVLQAMKYHLTKAEKTFIDALKMPGLESIEIAQDIALENNLRIPELGEKFATVEGLWANAAWSGPNQMDETVGYFDLGTTGAVKWDATRYAYQEGFDLVVTYWFRGEEWTSKIGLSMARSSVQSPMAPLAKLQEARRRGAEYAWHAVKVLKRAVGSSISIAELRERAQDFDYLEPLTPEELFEPPQEVHRAFVQNPSEQEAKDEERAVDKFREFNRFDPKTLTYDAHFEMPKRVRKLGEGVEVLYESMKVIPDNLKRPRKPVGYFHEFEGDVFAYACDGKLDTDVPEFIVKTDALALLGDCMGFSYKGGEAKSTAPLPELYATPCGRALLVIQSKKSVLAMFWGGALAVEPRGITG